MKLPQVNIFTARSERQWTTEEPAKQKVPSANILRQQNSIERPATSIQTVKDVFQLLMTQEMVLLLLSISMDDALGYNDLVQPHLNWRRQQPQAMQRIVSMAMQAIGQSVTTLQLDTVPATGVKRRCQLCSRERDRKFITHCTSCNIPCYLDYHKVICTMFCKRLLK
ncbi:unnamed protein product [Rotaria sp. Silwood2]|nr:unnamed protein product [Rotaria sp. Silwood2]